MSEEVNPNSLDKDILLKKLDILSNNTKFVLKIFLLCMIPSILNGLNMTSYVYLAEVPEYWCAIDNFNESWTQQQMRTISSPKGINGSSCSKYNWDYNVFESMSYDEAINYFNSHPKPDTIPCDKYEYLEGISSMVITYDLVCEQAAFKSIVQVALSLGKFLGAFLFGVLADKYGRRRSFALGTLLYIISGPLISCAYSYIVMIIGRIALGAASSGVYQSAYVILSEVSSSEKRAFLSIVYNMSYPIGQMIVPLIAYYIRNWRILQMVIAGPSVFVLIILWMLPESPRWLISKGYLEKAAAIIDKELPTKSIEVEQRLNTEVPVTNKTEDSASVHSDSKTLSCSVKIKASVQQLWDLLRFSELRNRLFIILFCWSVCSLSYYALALNVDNFHSDRYVYGFLTGLVEVPSYILPLPFLKYMGRKQTSIILLYSSGFALLSILAIPEQHTGDFNLLLLVIASIGRLCISGVFAVVILHTSELFPTTVRNTAVGCGSTSSHIGSMSAPFVVDLLGAYAWFIPSTLCGVAALLAGSVVFLLPETKNRVLPEEVEMVQNAHKNERVGFHQICI